LAVLAADAAETALGSAAVEAAELSAGGSALAVVVASVTKRR
jgi:hypothetical protein